MEAFDSTQCVTAERSGLDKYTGSQGRFNARNGARMRRRFIESYVSINFEYVIFIMSLPFVHISAKYLIRP